MSSIRSSPEGIYRRVSVRIWADEKFQRLSALKPSGQALWLYLLTGPHTSAIPGVFVIGRAALAENLGWEAKAFDEAFDEVLAEGLAAFDPKVRLWWVPNAVRHNTPFNPNVVLSWRSQWSLVPECPLREQIEIALQTALALVSPAFSKAFETVCGKPSPNARRKPLAKQEAGDRKQEGIPTRRRNLKLTSLPEGFKASERVLTWAQREGRGDVSPHLEALTSYAKLKGAKYADWDEALMRAVRDNWGKVGQAKASEVNFAGAI